MDTKRITFTEFVGSIAVFHSKPAPRPSALGLGRLAISTILDSPPRPRSRDSGDETYNVSLSELWNILFDSRSAVSLAHDSSGEQPGQARHGSPQADNVHQPQAPAGS